MKTTIRLAFIVLLLVYLSAAGPKAQAVSPAPDGGYPGGNTAEGQAALLSLTIGGFNTAVGLLSLRSNTTNSLNTAVGAGTLLANTADENTAVGAGALLSNTIGGGHAAYGAFALFSNTTGVANTAIGDRALFHNTTGIENTAIGVNALVSNTTGDANTALGIGAGSNVTTASNVICIGSIGGADVSSTCFIDNIRGVTTQNPDAIPVLVDSAGQLGTVSSSRRFKKEIKPMDKTSEAILALKPVTFHYKSDKTGTPQFGLIAEEVAEANPDLVVRDKNGEVYTVRYDAVNAMLLNEFLKEHRKVEQQGQKIQEQDATIARQREEFDATITALKKEMATVVAHANEQDSKIQKVSDQVQMNSSAARVVTSNH
jgi:hypothetical protein